VMRKRWSRKHEQDGASQNKFLHKRPPNGQKF
jgi:hypothetical protein